MKTLSLWAAALGLFALTSAPARAVPMLSFEYLGSGQVLSTTDTITVRGRITNTGDTAMPFSLRSSFTFRRMPQPAYDQYLWISGGFPTGPTNFVALDPGESLEWAITTLGPYPITGLRGDPVLPGEYYLETDGIVVTYAAIDPITFALTGERFTTTAAPARFTWTVLAETASVPAPGMLLLLAGGLAALARARRRP